MIQDWTEIKGNRNGRKTVKTILKMNLKYQLEMRKFCLATGQKITIWPKTLTWQSYSQNLMLLPKLNKITKGD